MEQQTATLNTLKPVDDLAPQHSPEELEKDFEGFYAVRKDAEKVLYLTRGADTEAFMDHGSHIHILTREPAEQKQSIQAAIEIAKERGWRELEVTGTEDFRRQVWMEASLAGIQVRGYVPTPEDKVELEKLRPGSAPAPAELEPSKISAVEPEQKPEPIRTEDQEKFRKTNFPHLTLSEYLEMEKKMTAYYQALPRDAQGRVAAPMLAINGEPLQPITAEQLAKEERKERDMDAMGVTHRIHELKAQIADAKAIERKAIERIEGQNRGNDRAADTSRQTTGPGR